VTERWPKILNIVLALALLPIVVAYVYQGIEIKALHSSYDQTLQTLHTQTHLIAELRQELNGLHYQNFESQEALQSWVNDWRTTRMPIVLEFFSVGVILREQKYSEYFDCDDFAEAMQRDALRNGYLTSVALVDGEGCVFGTKVTELRHHSGIIALTSNSYWYVEPQTGSIVEITRRD